MKKLIITIIITVMAIGPLAVFGAAANINVKSTEGAVGDTVQIVVTISGNSVARINGSMEYDSSKLEYIDGATNIGGENSVILKTAATGEDIVFTMNFKVKEQGDCPIKVDIREAYDLDEVRMSNPQPYSETLKFTAKAEEQKETQVVDSNKTEKDKDKAKTKQPGTSPFLEGNFTYILIGGAVILLILIILIIRKARK